MSTDKEVPSEHVKKSYFCGVCFVAFLNRDGLRSHYKDEEHIEMEEALHGQSYGKYFHNLKEYIFWPTRKEPLIGLQYIIQLYPDVDSKDAFKCSLCKVRGPLYFMMKHIESYKHRMSYLNIAYKELVPQYDKGQSFYERNFALRKSAIKVEQQEKTIPVNDSKSCDSRVGVKIDFWKCNQRRQEKLEEFKEKRSAYEAQKQNILQYMETLVITSPEEAAFVQNLTEELEEAVNVYNQNVKEKKGKCKRGRWQTPKESEGMHSRHSVGALEEVSPNGGFGGLSVPFSSLEPSSREFTPLMSQAVTAATGHGHPLVWILGDSLVYWAAKRAEVQPGGLQLGITNAELRWHGVQDMRWLQVFPEVQAIGKISQAPVVLVVHAGGNNLGTTRVCELISLIMRHMDRFPSFFQSSVIVWSEVVPRVHWRNARDLSTMERSRRQLNMRVSRHVRAHGGVVVRHRQLEGNNQGLLKSDGVLLNDNGLDIFLSGVRDGIESALSLLREKVQSLA